MTFLNVSLLVFVMDTYSLSPLMYKENTFKMKHMFKGCFFFSSLVDFVVSLGTAGHGIMGLPTSQRRLRSKPRHKEFLYVN
jgi:hypothetical protein